jgi:hypothetical protein
VRSFFDANGDGIGDFPGLTQKLDYLQSLGVTCLWLMPFYVSPLKDDGYDIADYYGIHPAYGTRMEFRRFLREAHRRGLRVLTELVINHTSTHAVLKRPRRALDARHPGRVFLAEANQWPEDVRPYFGDGDECHMAYHFPLMPRVFVALRRLDWMAVGVDRVDYTKGILERFRAVEHLLDTRPEYRGRFTLVQIGAPMPGDVPPRRHEPGGQGVRGRAGGRRRCAGALPVRWNKGRAAALLIRHAGAATVLAVGDDATDEDMFRAVKGRGVSVRVAPAGPTAADYILPAPADVAALLKNLKKELAAVSFV